MSSSANTMVLTSNDGSCLHFPQDFGGHTGHWRTLECLTMTLQKRPAISLGRKLSVLLGRSKLTKQIRKSNHVQLIAPVLLKQNLQWQQCTRWSQVAHLRPRQAQLCHQRALSLRRHLGIFSGGACKCRRWKLNGDMDNLKTWKQIDRRLSLSWSRAKEKPTGNHTFIALITRVWAKHMNFWVSMGFL